LVARLGTHHARLAAFRRYVSAFEQVRLSTGWPTLTTIWRMGLSLDGMVVPLLWISQSAWGD